MLRVVVLVGALLALAGGEGAGAVAQEATPAPFPVTPDPSECRVAPRSADEVIALFGIGATPAVAAATPAGPPTSVEVPIGRPADAATVAGVTATVREVLACFNAGDFPRAIALFTDEAVRRGFAPEAGEAVSAEEARAFLAATPVPVPAGQRQMLLAVADVSRLADGRVGAFVVVDDPAYPPEGPEVLYVFFIRSGDRWLVDDFVEFNAV